jgi:hypothetical protein
MATVPAVRRRIIGAQTTALLIAITMVVSLSACTKDADKPPKEQVITIADLVGVGRDYALQLVGNLHLDVKVVTLAELPERNELARDVVLRQDPVAGTKVPAGSTLTLFVPEERELRSQERPFRLITHCGLALPVRFEREKWLPVNDRLARSVNPPDGFSSDGFYDHGTIRRIDRNSMVYTSSMGIEVEYAPTKKPLGTCE